ncbi:MAG: protein kinase [Pirellulales bacterium]
MASWVFDKSKSLGEQFIEREIMDADQCRLLEALVVKHVEKHGGELEQSLAQLSSVDPHATQSLAEIDDADLNATVRHIGSRSLASDTTIPFRSGDSESRRDTDSSTRYKVIRPHAKGGLGEVFLAEDKELSREVALKEIQLPYADDNENRERFLREAEITGNLEHPGIVPVYGLGKYDNGRPFYAMRFIRGESLKEAIEAYHSRFTTSTSDGEAGLELRKLLRRFVDVCNAIAYAHSRGVLHRDLKPGNIVLGKYGETLVVDWGLAKAKGTQEAVDTTQGSLSLSSDSGATPTMVGSAIGTPAFMSPEQAAGKIDELDGATDVYGLGATLFFLLTGCTPVEGKTRLEVLKNAEAGNVRKPRDLRSDVPKALEAVCLKAMAKSPSDRYESAAALGNDMERWLADEPVRAWPEPIREKLTRWVRKRQAYVVSVASTLLILTISFFVVGLVLARSLKQERSARLLDRRRLYDADMTLAQRDWEIGRISSYWKRLDKYNGGTTSENTPNGLRSFEWNYLSNKQPLAILNISGHRDLTNKPAISSRGEVATIDAFGNVQVFDMRVGKRLRLIYPERNDADFGHRFITYTPDGNRLIVMSVGGGISVLDSQSGEQAFRIDTSQVGINHVTRVLHNPIRRTLLTIDPLGGTYEWSVDTGVKLAKKMDRRFGEPASFSPNGKLLAFIDAQRVQVRNAESFDHIATLEPSDEASQPNGAQRVEFSSDGALIAVSYIDRSIRIWRVEDHSLVATLRGHRDEVWLLQFDPSCKKLASLSWENIRIWDVSTGNQLASIRLHTGVVNHATFGSQWGEVFTHVDNTLRKSNFLDCGETLTAIYDPTPPKFDLTAVAPDAMVFARGEVDSGISLVDIRSGNVTRSLYDGSGETVRRLATSSDASLFASYHGHSIDIIDGQSGKVATTIQGLVEEVTCLAFDSTSTHLAVGCADGSCRVWDITSGKAIYSSSATGDRISAVHFKDTSHIGFLYGATLSVFDLREKRSMCEWTDRRTRGNLTDFAFSSDGRHVATSCIDDTIKVWNLTDQSTLLSFEAETQGVVCLTYSRDGKRIASGGTTGQIKLWDVETGQEVLELHEHTREVFSLVFDQSGDTLISASRDGTVKCFFGPSSRLAH